MNYDEIEALIKSLPISEKAYVLNTAKLEEGYYYTEYVSYAPTRGKAKRELLEPCEYCAKLLGSNEDVVYTNIPIIRYKYLDKYSYNGMSLTRDEIVALKEKEFRDSSLEEILASEEITHCYIRKRGAYYKPGSCGYTELKTRAGVFLKQEAVSSGRSSKELDIIPIDTKKHNYMIKEEIKTLKLKLIG
jgi:hypothetical protein